jgi:hypothetical protein
LGFFHIDVQEDVNRCGFMKFLDNCAILTIEEGKMGANEIVENYLQDLFDKKWH